MTVAPLYWRYDGVQSTGKWKEFDIMKCKYRVEYFHKVPPFLAFLAHKYKY
jgi:hypothetical protein